MITSDVFFFAYCQLVNITSYDISHRMPPLYPPFQVPGASCFASADSALGIQSPCQRMIGVYNHLLRKVFRFHYHSQKVIGSLGLICVGKKQSYF